jgi:very-short-patch-repair endonuclease
MKAAATDMASLQNVERSRLLSLIDFSQQSARLRSKPTATVSAHNLFALYEHEIQGLPAIRVNVNGLESEDEIWLAVGRLRETGPPEITHGLLLPWVQMTESPTDEPQLREVTNGASLIEAGTHCSLEAVAEQDKPAISPGAIIAFSDYDKAKQVHTQFNAYLETKWRAWADEERLRRKTIRLYSDLFTLKQKLEGSIVETQVELVWGVGLGVWNCNGTTVSYPLAGRLVEMSLDAETGDIEVRPRDADVRLEVDWYASVDNPGVADVEKAAKEFLSKAVTTFSPFERGTFEPLLYSATTNLDANGVYWPNEVPPEDRTVPKPDNKLKVTDTWVLFARPRSNNQFLQDLDKLKKQAEEAAAYPPAAAAIVTDPDTSNPVVELPLFRGVSGSDYSGSSGGASGNKKARDIYFPKPFNDEQVRIIQLLDVSDGVVVQGPPGTGKTHTIANVICHHLAEGKRVLVTSMKDAALTVLQEQLPAEIRPLAISLLTSEQEGMKQFEHAIHKIASEVQSLDRMATARAINHLEESLDTLHGKLSTVDLKIGEWAKQSLAKITLESEEIDPQDAAREVVANIGQFEWFPDTLGIAPEFAPQFTDADVVRLREARRALAQDIDYLDASLPQLVEFPDSKALLEVHRDLSQSEKLRQSVERGDVPALANSSHETLSLAQQLLADTERLHNLRDEVGNAHRPWTHTMGERLRRGGTDDLLRMLEVLGGELEQAMELRKKFIERPVAIPTGVEVDEPFLEAVGNLAQGKSAFGLRGLFVKAEQKKRLDEVTVLGARPTSALDWMHVNEHVRLLRRLSELALRWNTLAPELQLDLVSGGKVEGALAAAQEYALYRQVKCVVKAEGELCIAAVRVFPNWACAREVTESVQRLAEMEKALRHHLTKDRLANVWVAKERFQRILEDRSGRVIADIRTFLAGMLGNPAVEDAQMQARWSELMAEVARVQRLGIHLIAVREICDSVEASGAPRYATALKQPPDGTSDGLLPDNWRKVWRLRRLATHLDVIDGQQALKQLAKERHELESELSRAYRDVVVQRTWLRLAENASPSIRAALQAYLNAIQKIGKGRGKRAVRYRQDARMAAAQANPAVPCWIMPHYRVSESLPAELGCFDLVIIDEASQSDLTALPSVLRAKKVLIVGDDKQVSPEGVGLEEERVISLMKRFLGDQVDTYRPQMSPERSIYDLFKVVFAKSAVMLKEHFRCVGPIIEYSKREFYNHELRPLRVPKASERLDPPLIDVVVQDGYRAGDLNRLEVRYIIEEIKAIAADPAMADRSIGVVSLLADKQALEVWERLTHELGPEVMQRHRIACGDARTFQGKERDIIFLSMVSAPNYVGAPLSRDTFAQRFNVAASRARDRMYLVRSVGLEHLSEADRLRRSLIGHFATPFAQDEKRVEDLRTLCESPFEREVYDELTQRGFWVTPQVQAGQFRIDMVVEGHEDARLAVECDGDKYHGPDKWADDMQRQRVLERAGWVFWRCFASAFYRRRQDMLDDLLRTLTERGIGPIGDEGASRSLHVEQRFVTSAAEPPNDLTGEDAPPKEAESNLSLHNGVSDERKRVTAPSLGLDGSGLALSKYTEYAGAPGSDPRSASTSVVAHGLVRIIETEGPVVAKRVYDIYLRSCGIRRMGHELKSRMDEALTHAIEQGYVVAETDADRLGLLFAVVRVNGSPPIRLRLRGPRTFEEIPPSELYVAAKRLAERDVHSFGSEEHLRATLEAFDLKRLTTQVGSTLRDILAKRFPYLDELLYADPE